MLLPFSPFWMLSPSRSRATSIVHRTSSFRLFFAQSKRIGSSSRLPALSTPARSKSTELLSGQTRSRTRPRSCRRKTQQTSAAAVESRKGAVSRRNAFRFPSPLIKPDVRFSRIRLSDWFRRKAHGGGPMCTRRRCSTPNSPNTSSRENRRVPRPCTLCRRTRKCRTWS